MSRQRHPKEIQAEIDQKQKALRWIENQLPLANLAEWQGFREWAARTETQILGHMRTHRLDEYQLGVFQGKLEILGLLAFDQETCQAEIARLKSEIAGLEAKLAKIRERSRRPPPRRSAEPPVHRREGREHADALR